MKKYLFLSVVFVVFFCGTWLFLDKEKFFVRTIYNMSARHLVEKADTNSIEAEQKWGGKTVKITGWVNQIGKDGSTPYIDFYGIRMLCKSSEIAAIAKLQPGYQAIIQGTLRSSSLHNTTKSPYMREFIFVDDCRVIWPE